MIKTQISLASEKIYFSQVDDNFYRMKNSCDKILSQLKVN